MPGRTARPTLAAWSTSRIAGPGPCTLIDARQPVARAISETVRNGGGEQVVIRQMGSALSWPERSVESAYRRGTSNSIGFLRWVFASAVIFYHGYIIAAFTVNPISQRVHIPLGDTAVDCFFLLSGFLIARSVRSSSGIFDFMFKRVLRIFPGFWLCLVVTAGLLAPLSWLHNHGSLVGFPSARPWTLLTKNWTLTLEKQWIPGVFIDTAGFAHANINSAIGSAWSLIYEFKAYIVVGLLGAVGILWRQRIVTAVLTFLLGGMQVAAVVAVGAGTKPALINRGFGALLAPLGDPSMMRLIFTFLVGTCFALYADRIILRDRTGIACIIAILLIGEAGTGFIVLAMPLAAYVVLWLGARLSMKWWDKAGDSSYGVYLYGWPIETLFAEWGIQRHLGMIGYCAVSIIVSTAFGLASWHLLEKHALRLKGFDPYRSIKSRLVESRMVRQDRRRQAGPDDASSSTGFEAPRSAAEAEEVGATPKSVSA